MAANSPVRIVSGRYHLIERLGAGGMGIVYRALDMLTGQHVALKRVIFTNKSQTEVIIDVRLALAQEFQTLASLRHPHIISVLDYGFDSTRQPYFTMDLLEHPESLLEAARSRRLAPKVDLLVQTLQALLYLHRRGVLHRDLKPGNVLIVNGQVKVLDFGLSGMVSPSETILGTPAYMAPELLRGELPTPASDLYAVGVMAYELLAGHHPFDTSNITRLVSQVLNTQPDITGLSAYLDMDAPETPPATLPEFEHTHIGQSLNDADQSPVTRQHPDQDEKDEKTTITPLGKAYKAHNADQYNATTRTNRALNETVAHTDTQPTAPEHPLIAIVQKLLNKNPQYRYTDAAAVIHDLSEAMHTPLPVETVATRESFLQAAQFVGREVEFDQLTVGLKQALNGQGNAWLIGGESGVGKSRLLDELRIHALVGGALVLRGQAISEIGLPYQVWREPLRRLALTTALNDSDAAILKTIVPDIDHLLGKTVPVEPQLDPEQAQKRLLAVIASIFRRQTQPVVLILEDLHWAGSESYTALNQLVQSIRDIPLLILGSYRDDERPDLPKTLPEMQSMKLNRLSETDIATLSASILGEAGRQTRVIEFLQRETEGNIFFLVEVVRALAEEAGQLDKIGSVPLPVQVVTGGVQRIVQRRLSRVPEAARPLLQIAAVLGRQLDLRVLLAAADGKNLESWLTACSDAAILEVQDEHWRFAHDKLREGVLAALPPEARPILHRQAALALEATTPDQVVALAYHWDMAGDAAKTLRYATLAGEQANQVSAYDAAIAYFKRALDLLADLSNTAELVLQRAKLMTRLGQVYTRQNAYSLATQLLQDGLALATRIGNQAVAAEALCYLGNVAGTQGKHDEASGYYTQSLTISREINNRRTMATAIRGLAQLAADLGQYAEATQRFIESVTISREIGDRWGTAYGLNSLAHVAMVQGQHTAAAQSLEESLSLLRALGDRRGIGVALINLGLAALYQGEHAKAVQWFKQGLVISHEIGDRWNIAAVLNNLGYVALLQKDYPQARHYLEESLERFRLIGNRGAITQALMNLGHVAAGLGDDAAAERRYGEALHSAIELGAAPLMLEILAGIARLRANAGATIEALELIGLTLSHPGTNADIKVLAEPLLAELRARLPAATINAALEYGKNRDLKVVAAEILVGTAPH